ncbi:hypothetical protein LTR36_009959 [Oleoguttula mirabilis]|uniref:Uncharacterized protein n=1 Tax=Oleoguttula mirabilis TaxID=1507867 RepID=A0AAV9J4M8_9PEZI|nr:hypothetical protein LTR36_009959 [Oleoguttula mirabilis]
MRTDIYDDYHYRYISPLSTQSFMPLPSRTTYPTRCHWPRPRPPGIEILRVFPTERVSDPHDFCRRTDALYAELYRELVRQREHMEAVWRRLDRSGHRFGHTERRETRALYEDLRWEVWRLQRRVDERRMVIVGW